VISVSTPLGDFLRARRDATSPESLGVEAGTRRRVPGLRQPVPVRAPGDVLVHLRRARDHVDRHFTERIELDHVAAVAGLSKFHFHRLFTAVYGVTPARYLTQRRIERAQDLLRATNLTVTEVCFAVGYSSLGSFSTRFSELVGETPSAFQRRYTTSGAPRIPGCFVFMWGLAERRSRSNDSARQEKSVTSFVS
jgi:AraC-like DNA-binding protein